MMLFSCVLECCSDSLVVFTDESFDVYWRAAVERSLRSTNPNQLTKAPLARAISKRSLEERASVKAVRVASAEGCSLARVILRHDFFYEEKPGEFVWSWCNDPSHGEGCLHWGWPGDVRLEPRKERFSLADLSIGKSISRRGIVPA